MITTTKRLIEERVLPCVRRKYDDDLPKAKWEDLDVYLRIMFDEERSAVVTEDMLNEIDISFNDLLDTAMNNLQENIKVGKLGDVLHELTGAPYEDFEDDPILIATTKYNTYGAGAVTVLDRFMKNKWIIPCSIHEVIMISKEFVDEAGLSAIIKDVNASFVDEKEILSDHPYDIDKVNGVAQ